MEVNLVELVYEPNKRSYTHIHYNNPRPASQAVINWRKQSNRICHSGVTKMIVISLFISILCACLVGDTVMINAVLCVCVIVKINMDMTVRLIIFIYWLTNVWIEINLIESITYHFWPIFSNNIFVFTLICLNSLFSCFYIYSIWKIKYCK